MLLALAIEVKRMLDLVAEALTVRRVAVATILLLVYVASATALFNTSVVVLAMCGQQAGSFGGTYTRVEILLALTKCRLGNEVLGMAGFMVIRA